MSDMLDRVCAYYMAIGVSFYEFWNGDYTQLKYRIEANRLMLKERNREMWIQGMYVYDAVMTALYNANRGKKTQKEYMDKPIRITKQSEEEKEEEAKNILEQFKASLSVMTGRLERREKNRAKEAEAKEKVEAMMRGR